MNTLKQLSEFDGTQTLRQALNDVDSSYTTSGFLTALVGRKIIFTTTTTTVSGDTLNLAFSENGIALYTLQLIFTDGTQATIISAARIA